MGIESASSEFRFREIERRLGAVEAVKPDVLAERVAQLTARVNTLIKVGTAVLVSLVGAAISFAFMTLSLLGHA